jgi:hypothetical protein
MKARANETGLMKNLAASLVAVVAVICCLAAPLILAGIGSIAIGSFVGWLIGAVVFAAVCFLLLKRTQRRC